MRRSGTKWHMLSPRRPEKNLAEQAIRKLKVDGTECKHNLINQIACGTLECLT